MFKKNLCSHCKTGKYTYELDRHSPVCPYLSFHNGDKCGMYKRLRKQKNYCIIVCFIKRLLGYPPRKISL